MARALVVSLTQHLRRQAVRQLHYTFNMGWYRRCDNA